ncbi:MAG: hypothetical protein RJB38_822 [Pseudomonadota bacterium]|jgi:8-oxo-dGTP diphosphatase
MNAYQSGERKIVPASLVYLYRQREGAEREWLLIHRQGREDDIHSGKWNGLGGKFDPEESPWQAAAREVHEESGLVVAAERFRWLGTLQFPRFRPDRSEDWWCAVLTAEVSVEDSECIVDGARHCDEGTLHWIQQSRLQGLNFWEGDRHFLPRVLDGEPFFGTFRYEKQKLIEWVLEPRKTN